MLERRCPECSFEAAAVPLDGIAALIRENAAAWQRVLGGDGSTADLTERPSEDRWSALEYACHVRDVFRLYDYRLGLMLNEDDPAYPNWDQDVTAVEDRYNEQDPSVVAGELRDAAEALARSFEGVHGDQWSRTGTRSDGARFTVETFARYMIHDPVHHLHDVGGG